MPDLLNEELSRIMTLAEFGNFSRHRKGGNTTYTDDKGVVHTVTNRQMNDETYALRRQAMEFVYRAKRLTHNALMRITVRIADMTTPELRRSDILGLAQFGSGEIWLPAHMLTEGWDVQEIVYHEILHAAYSIGHIEESPIMRAGSYKGKNLPPDVADQIFVSHTLVPNADKWVRQYAAQFKKYL